MILGAAHINERNADIRELSPTCYCNGVMWSSQLDRLLMLHNDTFFTRFVSHQRAIKHDSFVICGFVRIYVLALFLVNPHEVRLFLRETIPFFTPEILSFDK